MFYKKWWGYTKTQITNYTDNFLVGIRIIYSVRDKGKMELLKVMSIRRIKIDKVLDFLKQVLWSW